MNLILIGIKITKFIHVHLEEKNKFRKVEFIAIKIKRARFKKISVFSHKKVD